MIDPIGGVSHPYRMHRGIGLIHRGIGLIHRGNGLIHRGKPLC